MVREAIHLTLSIKTPSFLLYWLQLLCVMYAIHRLSTITNYFWVLVLKEHKDKHNLFLLTLRKWYSKIWCLGMLFEIKGTEGSADSGWGFSLEFSYLLRTGSTEEEHNCLHEISFNQGGLNLDHRRLNIKHHTSNPVKQATDSPESIHCPKNISLPLVTAYIPSSLFSPKLQPSGSLNFIFCVAPMNMYMIVNL